MTRDEGPEPLSASAEVVLAAVRRSVDVVQEFLETSARQAAVIGSLETELAPSPGMGTDGTRGSFAPLSGGGALAARGVGFTWRMTCSGGTGSCLGNAIFSPPKILAGKLHQSKKGPRLNLSVPTFKCGTPCQTSSQGRFEVKMKSRNQLNRLFGRTLAFSIILECPGGPSSMVSVKVFIDQKGVLKAHR